ncbi:MAG: hypothetical protein JXA99_17270 [Candidatus Lokiarchaeota archaeon]|nr:hypothetical protein [Candidatus Lokiarchaeota archaeon]
MNFEQILFPLTGDIANLLLIIEWIVVFLYFEFALIFLHRTLKFKKKLKSYQERGYVFLFLGLSLMIFFFILGDHYAISQGLRLIYLNCGYITLMFGALIFIFIIEMYQIFLKKYLFTLIFVGDIILYIIFISININYGQIATHTFWVIFIFFFIFYSKELRTIFKSQPSLGDFKSKYLELVFGIFFTILGFALTTDFIIQSLGLILRFIGNILQLFGLFILFLFFISIPSFLEYDWQKKIDNLYIIHKSGLLIYVKSFLGGDESPYDSSISGIITSLKMMLEHISNKEDISVIEQKGKIIIIQPGSYIYGVLICEVNLDSLHILLNNFIEKIEIIYSNILKEWDGDLKVLRPIDNIIKDYFF